MPQTGKEQNQHIITHTQEKCDVNIGKSREKLHKPVM